MLSVAEISPKSIAYEEVECGKLVKRTDEYSAWVPTELGQGGTVLTEIMLSVLCSDRCMLL